MQAIDKTLVGTNWVDLYTLFGIPLTESFRLQNKGSDWITLQAVATQPAANSLDGIVLETFDSVVITPEAGGAWARVTNNYITNAVITYHPLQGLHDEVYTGEGGGSSTVDGSVSVKGVRNTLAQELLVGHRNDDINVQFQYNVSYNQDQSDTVGSTSGTATITHSNSMAVLQSTSTGSAFLRSADSIRYFPGHEFSAEMTAIASSGVSGSSVWELEIMALRAIVWHLQCKMVCSVSASSQTVWHNSFLSLHSTETKPTEPAHLERLSSRQT